MVVTDRMADTKQYPDLPTLAARLVWARERLKLTQMQLETKCGVSRDAIQKIESGITLRPRRIGDLAAALDVSPAWLQFGAEYIDQLSVEALEIARAWDDMSDDDPNKIVTKKILVPQAPDC